MSTQRTPLLLTLFLVSFSLIKADLYGNPSPPPTITAPSPPPPFAVAGKQFPPQSTTCIDPKSPCFNKVVSCPQQCSQFKPSDPNTKGCFIDCNNPKCEGICKTRKPNCEGNGAACYDPRFIGGDGIVFYFHGKANRHFALVSDHRLQINARFIGLRPAGRPRDFTWIQSLGILFGTHTFTLSAVPTASWDPQTDHLSFTYDGVNIPLAVGHLSTWAPPAGGLQVERTATVNGVTVTVPEVVEIMAAVVPVTREDDRVHRYGLPEGDCFAHLEVQFRFWGLSERVEGVLGQTYRPGFESPVKRGVAMPVMGGEDRYATAGLLSAGCRSCIFSPEVVAVDGLDSVGTLDCSSKMSNGYAVVCRR